MIDVLEKRGKDASMEKKSVSTKGGIKMVWTMGQRYYRHPLVLYSLGDEKHDPGVTMIGQGTSLQMCFRALDMFGPTVLIMSYRQGNESLVIQNIQ